MSFAAALLQVALLLLLLLLLQGTAISEEPSAPAEDIARREQVYRELAQAFDQLDFEGDGSLDRAGFFQLVADMNVTASRGEIDGVFNQVFPRLDFCSVSFSSRSSQRWLLENDISALLLRWRAGETERVSCAPPVLADRHGGCCRVLQRRRPSTSGRVVGVLGPNWQLWPL
eukprot:SAG31_NODE_2840_length_5016_cov_15.783608_4_plen_172_part_00